MSGKQNNTKSINFLNRRFIENTEKYVVNGILYSVFFHLPYYYHNLEPALAKSFENNFGQELNPYSQSFIKMLDGHFFQQNQELFAYFGSDNNQPHIHSYFSSDNHLNISDELTQIENNVHGLFKLPAFFS